MSRQFQQLCKHNGIYHYFAGGSTHGTVIERWHRTLKCHIARFQYKNNTETYIHDLQNLIDAYSKTYHRSIKMAPINVTTENQEQVYRNLYANKEPLNPPKPFKFKVKDKVCISGIKHPFAREFFQRWSEEVFTISKTFHLHGYDMYKVKSCAGDELVGSFYSYELIKSPDNSSEKYRIERIIDEKVVNGVKKLKVQFQGQPKQCSEWIKKASVRSV